MGAVVKLESGRAFATIKMGNSLSSSRQNRLAGLESLLPELQESASDQLPLGTKIFPSAYRYPNNVQAAMYSSILMFFVLLVVSSAE